MTITKCDNCGEDISNVGSLIITVKSYCLNNDIVREYCEVCCLKVTGKLEKVLGAGGEEE